MLDDVLNENPLFSLFLSSSHYTVAASHSLTVVVPPASSLHSLSPRLSSSLVDSHVLRVSPYFVGQYLTANGRSIGLVDGRSLHCLSGGGWSREEEGRVSRVLESETYYDDEFASFTVLRVDMPLEGRVSAEYERSVRCEGSAGSFIRLLPRRPLVEHEILLQRLTGELSATSASSAGGASVLPAVRRFVHQFNSSYVLVRGFLDDAGRRVADACSRLTQEALSRVSQRSRDGRRQMAAEVSAAVECAVMSGIHSKLFGGLVELHAADEQRMQAAIARLRRLSMESLGIRADIRCQPMAACQLMAALGTHHTPLQKMAQLEEVYRAITQAVRDQTDSQHTTTSIAAVAVEQSTDASGQSTDAETVDESRSFSPPHKRDLVLSAEDMIPLTLYVLIHSRLPHITAHLAHLHHFPPTSASECVDQLAVHFVNFQAACQLVQAGKVSSVEQAAEEGKEAEHSVYAAVSATSPASTSTDGTDVSAVGSSAVHVARRSVQHSRSVSSSVALSSLHSTVRRSPASSPTPPLNRSSSLHTVDDSTSASINVTHPAAVWSNGDTDMRSARLQRRHATLPTQTRRSQSPANNKQPPLQPPHSHYQLPHNQQPSTSAPTTTQPRPLPSRSSPHFPSTASDDERLGDFLSRLKRSDDVVTGNITVHTATRTR